MSAKPQEVATLKSRLESAATAKMTRPDWFETAYGIPAGILPDRNTVKDIKREKKDISRICAVCQKLETKEEPVMICSRCHRVFYCSKECQIRDWPKHKVHCTNADSRQKRMERLVKTIEVNKDVMAYLKIVTILLLDLLNSPTPGKPFYCLVHIGVEPTNIIDFARLRGQMGLEQVPSPTEKLKGMVQINDVRPLPDGLTDTEQLEMHWRAKKADVDAAGFTSDPVGVMVFMMGDVSAVIGVPVHITSIFMDVARKAPPFEQTVVGMSRTQSLDMSTCIEYINTTIRQDKTNQFLLRTDMTPADRKIIEQSTEEKYELKSLGVKLLRGRMVREYIYRVLLGLNVPGPI